MRREKQVCEKEGLGEMLKAGRQISEHQEKVNADRLSHVVPIQSMQLQ